MSTYYRTIDTPLGCLTLYATDNALTAILYKHQTPTIEVATDAPQHPLLIECEATAATILHRNTTTI